MAPTDPRKSVLITGAGVGGIGGALAKEFHAKGYRVFAAARRLETVAELVAMGMEAVQLDVCKPEDVKRARDEVGAKTGGKLDVLVNNAGFATHRPATDLDIENTVKDMFDVNVFGVMRMVQEFVHLLIAAEGTIVNIGSIAPIVPLAFSTAYNATKSALHTYGDGLRIEMKPFNVHVITVVTGGVMTNIVREDNPRLPEDSLYKPVEEGWLFRVTSSVKDTMHVDDYAKSVVAQVVKPRWRQPLWLWKGHFSWMSWFLYTFTWKGFTDSIISRRFKLNRLSALLKKQKKGL